MTPTTAEPNLLFGVLALQADAIDVQKLDHACRLWAVRRRAPLAEILEERRWITPERRALVEHALERKLAESHGDPRAALEAALDERARKVLAGITHPLIRQALASPSAGVPAPTASTNGRPSGNGTPAPVPVVAPRRPRRPGRWRTALKVGIWVVLAASVGLGVWRLQVEHRDRIHADEEARLAVDTLDLQVRRLVEAAPGRRDRLTPVSDELLRSARDTYEHLAQTPGQTKTARTLRAHGTVGLAAAALGLRAPAGEVVGLAEQARDALQPLVADYPGEPRYRALQADAFMILARARLADGHPPEALDAYAAAAHLYDSLLQDDSASAEYRRGLAFSLVGLGEMHRLRFDWRTARGLYERAHTLLDQLMAENPRQAELRHQLAVTLRGLVSVCGNTGDQAARNRAMEPVRGIAGALAFDHPGVAAYQYTWARVLWADGVTHVGQLQAAREGIARAAVANLLCRSVLLDPFVGRFDQVLALSFGRMVREAVEAEIVLRRGLGVARRLRNVDPRKADYIDLMGELRVNLAEARALLGDHQRATAEVDGVLADGTKDGMLLFNTFNALARCAAAAGGDPRLPRAQRRALKQRLETRAVEVMARAKATGFPMNPDYFAQDPLFKSLTARPDYQKVWQTP